MKIAETPNTDKPQTDIPKADVKPDKPADKPADKVEEKPKPPAEGSEMHKLISRTNNANGRKKIDEDEPEPGAPKVEKPKTEKPKPKAEPKVEKEEPKPAVAPVAPVIKIDTKELGETIGRALREEKPKAEPKTEAEIELTPKQRRLHEGLVAMETVFKDDPQYATIAKNYKESISKWQTYVEEWQAKHPGETFDEKSPEHSAKQDELGAASEYDEEDFIYAQREVERRERVESEKRITGKLSELEQSKKLVEKSDEIKAFRAKAGNSFLEGMGDDFKAAVKADGSIDTAKLAEIHKADPVRHAIVLEHSTLTEILAEEAHKLEHQLVPDMAGVQITEHTPPEVAAKIKQHRWLGQFAYEEEQAYMQRPPDKQQDPSGRQFASRADFNAMPQAERAKRWTFSDQDFAILLKRKFTKLARTRLQEEDAKFESRLTARGIKLPAKPAGGKPTESNGVHVADDESLEDDGGKPLSPSAEASPRLAPRKTTDAEPPKTEWEAFTRRSNNRG